MNCTQLMILLQLSMSYTLHIVTALARDGRQPNNLTRYHTEDQISFGPNERFHDCQRIRSGEVSHENQVSHGAQSELALPIVEVTPFVVDFETDDTEEDASNRGHIAFVSNPARTVSVLEPLEEGGCAMKAQAYAVDMALKHECLLAVNAGFFNSATWGCLGNVVAGGRLAWNSHGIQNAHFGIRKDGTLYFGYLTEEDVLDEVNPFISLVGGVGWIIRDGGVYVDESMAAECGDTQETGTLDLFFDCKSARVVIGSDREGRVVIVHMDGKTFIEGVSLRQFAVWLLEQGVVNAINLDGGGSSAFVVNGTTVNYPADIRKSSNNRDLRYPRRVSTVICVHEPECVPEDCSGNGQCILGKCHCDGDWAEPNCAILFTTLRQRSNRSDRSIRSHLHIRHGSCTEDGLGDQCSSCHHPTGTSTNGHNEPPWTRPNSADLYTLLREIRCRRLVEFVLWENDSVQLLVLLVLFLSVVLNMFLLCRQSSCRSRNDKT